MFKAEYRINSKEASFRLPLPCNNKQECFKTLKAAKERFHQVGRCGYGGDKDIDIGGFVYQEVGTSWVLVWSIAL